LAHHHFIEFNLFSPWYTRNIKIWRQTTITHSFIPSKRRGRHGRDRMVLGFTTTYTISAYHYLSCELESHSWRCALDAILFDKVCQGFCGKSWFSPGTPVSSTIKTDNQDIADILWKVALNTITLPLTQEHYFIK